MVRASVRSLMAALLFFAGGAALAQSPRILYTWPGTGSAQGWFKNFGANTVTIANTVDGELTITETGEAGKGVAVSDDFNAIFEGGGGAGGLDATGLAALEIDVGHNAAGAVNVQFFVQASTASTFVALGGDVAVLPGVNTYSLPLTGLLPAQIAYIRTIGLNIRDHTADGNLVWTIREVRSVGAPLTERVFADHNPGASDNGLQGAIVNFDNAAVMGNDGGQNQSGLNHNIAAPPPGNSGSLRWTDLAGQNGGAVSWANGTVFGGNTYNERPTDMSNYGHLVLRIAATPVGGAEASVDVQYFLQTGNFNYQTAGPNQKLAADGQFHELCFPIDAITNRHLVQQHGINLGNHTGANLTIDVDSIRAALGPCPPVEAAPALALGGSALLCALFLAAGSLALRKKPARAR